MTRDESLDSLVGLLRARANQSPGGRAYSYLVDGELQEVSVSYGELDRQARAIAAMLQQHAIAGQRAVLLYPPDLSYVAAFFGCLYAGVIAVPAYPPDPNRLNRTLPRLQAITADSDADLVLTTNEILGMAQFLFAQAPDLGKKQWLATDSLAPGAESGWKEPMVAPEDVAFLQYTSGSTGTPKGVILSHGNLLANLELISSAFEIGHDSIGVSWLPPYHDMGLIGGILAPLYKGRPTALMSPVAFLQRPLRWLKAVSRHRATISGGPNFAYELCIRRVTPQDLEGLDLSCWTVAFTGAEPVRAETLQRFVDKFGPSGFRSSSFYPCYGLAEATLIVSGGAKGSEPVLQHLDAVALQQDLAVRAPPESHDGRTLVGCGASLGKQQVVIVRPATLAEAGPAEVGEIWVRGGSVAKGFWRNPEQTNHTFAGTITGSGAGPYLRTGDLGFISGGQLFITGRLKDLIIIRGRNHYPQDLEQTVEESHRSLRRGCCAAFSFELRGEELLVVAVEVERRHHERRGPPSNPPSGDRRATDRRTDNIDAIDHVSRAPTSALAAASPSGYDPDAICDAVRSAIQDRHELHVHDVVLLQPGTIPKTSSGKIQRRECRSSYLEGTLEKVASSVVRTEASRSTASVLLDIAPTVRALPADERRHWVQDFLKEQISRTLKVSSSRVQSNVLVSSLGLDSMMAVELAHRIERTLRVVLPPTAFLRDLTIQSLGDQVDLLLLDGEGADAVTAGARMAEVGLSAGQEALWYLQTLAPTSTAYNVPCAVRITSPLDIEALRAAFVRLVQRHAILRTTYPVVDGKPTLVVHEEAQFEFTARSVGEDVLQSEICAEAERPFDLASGPVLRVAVFTRGQADHVMLVTVHHIAADLWSVVLILEDLRRSYRPGSIRLPPVTPTRVDYRDFIQWQREYLASAAGERDWQYWRAQLADGVPVLELPTDRPRPAVQTFRGATLTFALDAQLVPKLRAAAEGTTLYIVLLAAFSALIGRYSGQEQVAVGSPVAGRPRADFDSVVGYFVNPLVLRADLSGDASFNTLLARLRTRVLDALEHQDFPFMRIVERLPRDRDPSRSPLFQVMFALEKPHIDSSKSIAHVALRLPGLHTKLGTLAVESWPVGVRSAQFDLALLAVDAGDRISCSLEYNTDLYDQQTAERLCDHYQTLLAAAVANPDAPLSRLPLMTDSELRRVVGEWNSLSSNTAPDACIHELFEARVASSPDTIAVAFGDSFLTYAELDRQAEAVARALRSRKLGPESRVAISVARSLELLPLLLGVLKAGAAYVPVDPRYPPDRQAMVLEDAKADLVVVDTAAQRGPAADAVPVMRLDELFAARTSGTPGRTSPSPTNAAYVIYTSGSTGRPKGVVVEHRSVVNFLHSMRELPGMSADDSMLAVTSLSFDIAGLELYLPLVVGGCVRIAPADVAADGPRLSALLRETRATVMQATPSGWELLADIGIPPHVRRLCGGEALRESLRTRLLEGGATLWNLYGPTETTIWSSAEKVDAVDPVNIGRPIANTQLYVLDRAQSAQPVGVPGELHIGGDGLARGYHQLPALTAERFVVDPFGRAGSRLYASGDTARQLSDGRLLCMGRRDGQIKLRGHRIELGDVEAGLRAHHAVRDAVAVVRHDGRGDPRVVAYVVGDDHGQKPRVDDLRTALRKRLPEYMIPADMIVLDKLPLTPNGKIDRRALPEPLAADVTIHVAPRTPLEEVLTELAAQVLGRPTLGIDDDFFALGGHSLLATQFVARVRDLLSVDLPLQQLFEAPTMALLADAIARRPDGPAAEETAELLLQVVKMSDTETRATLDVIKQRRVGGE